MTKLPNLLENRLPLINCKKYNFAHLMTIFSFALLSSFGTNHMRLNLDPFILLAGGTTQSNIRHKFIQFSCTWLITGSPTCIPNNTSTSWKVIMHSLVGIWNVRVSNLDISTSAVIKYQCNLMKPKLAFFFSFFCLCDHLFCYFTCRCTNCRSSSIII